MSNVLAFDFGASSGRAILGSFDGKKIELTEIHRFENNPVVLNGTLHWNILGLFHEIKQGMVKASNMGDFESIGIDTWGVDFGLISREGRLLENPVHYRDDRTSGMILELSKIIDSNMLYEKSGNQLMELNTIFQLYSLLKNRPELLDRTGKFLMTPDLFNYFLTGNKCAEETIASTTQLFNPHTRDWDEDTIEKIGFSKDIFPKVIKAGTIVGNISEDICAELDIKSKPVIAVASHDTASAVVAVPSKKDDFIFISCGTWSLVGTELEKPIINKISSLLNIANEAGYNKTTTFLKNIIGLWLIQETRRQFIRDGKNYSYSDIENMARKCDEFKCFINPNALDFVPKGDMPKRIQEFCRRTGQYIPQTDGEIVRCIYDSLAMEYRNSLNQIQACTQKDYNSIHMFGGGTKDSFLCQLTANATNCDVVAGPIEATAFGNVAVQLIALGKIKDIKQAREIVANSCTPTVYNPIDSDIWNKKFEDYKLILK